MNRFAQIIFALLLSAFAARAHDDRHRLTSLTRPAISQTVNFGYDSLGNSSTNGENGASAYGYGSRMPHAVKSASGTNYAYDANGNMLVRGNQRLAYLWRGWPEPVKAGPESICYSVEGRQFIATRTGVQISADDGPTQVILPVPGRSRVIGVALGGPDKDTLSDDAGL